MGTNARWKKANSAQILWILIIAAVSYGALSAYAWYRQHNEFLAVQFERPDGALTETFYLEVAANEAQRTKGLMFRKSKDLPKNGGMLFIFPSQKLQSFWMKDTPTSLDIIFINQDMQVVGVVNNAQPFSTAPLGVNRPSTYVVEVHAGTAKEKGIVEGAKFKPLRTIPVAQ